MPGWEGMHKLTVATLSRLERDASAFEDLYRGNLSMRSLVAAICQSEANRGKFKLRNRSG